MDKFNYGLLIVNKVFMYYNAISFVLFLGVGQFGAAAFAAVCGALNYYAVRTLQR